MTLRKDIPVPWTDQTELRASFRSFRSAMTNASAMTYDSSLYASETERSSVLTQASSFEIVNKPSPPPAEDEEPMSVEDAIGMYADFDVDGEIEKKLDEGIETVEAFMEARKTLTEELAPTLPPEQLSKAPLPSNPFYDRSELFLGPISTGPPLSMPKALSTSPEQDWPASPPENVPDLVPSATGRGRARGRSPDDARPTPVQTDSVHSVRIEKFTPEPRDRYGFKKASQQVTVEQYDEWNVGYTVYLERRRKKWEALMKQYGLSIENPVRFPPKSDKVKRYIRKGIPPEWRGAAWFWYAGGPDKLSREPGLYRKLIAQTQEGHLSDTDKDIIERDLHRTFPDNIKFKPDPVPEHISFPGKAIRPPRSSSRGEARILGSLRRVLQAFAIHNNNIGYCQSLNFLAGLLLLFLDEDEEKAFIMLNVITNEHMPGTHAKVLEANVDIGVLMSCVRECIPAVWAKIDDSEGMQPSRGRKASAMMTTRLPTVSLATTSWFMSCFVGNLPTESVLRVWDCLFYEGSKTLFRISLAIFKWGEQDIRNIGEQLEVFQVVQSVPRKLLDINALMESCFKRRNGFGHLSQETVEVRRRERRLLVRQERADREAERTRMIENQDVAATSSGKASLTETAVAKASSPSEIKAIDLPTTPVAEHPWLPDDAGSITERSRQGPLRRAASRARALRDQSRSRRREKANNWTDAQWHDAN
jgi:hypothetical protein